MTSLKHHFQGQRLLGIAIALVAGILLGSVQSYAGKNRGGGESAGRLGKTVFVDISVFGRKNKAAKRMTKMHLEYAREGWTVQDVSIYTENGDLQGFFVTYVKGR